VGFELHGPNWTLSVTDDGVGMPTDPAHIRTGLGTSIVQALARQLGAIVETAPGRPGTRVAITHTQIALVDDADEPVIGASAVGRPAA
jgi:two-component sensor histidine kinase